MSKQHKDYTVDDKDWDRYHRAVAQKGIDVKDPGRWIDLVQKNARNPERS
ncbi:hypothetical protein Psed_6845 (plasmid) [Pseudonocardia dioxanivorans CB1190]|uniref:Uncharacterized protein n=1 Tax=Pseudonocardia dioxanivorans (strain ATCC 55486 / DSM 44775 / JCM 13855 / CB1190) TaxID=675635 RepID=F2L6M2_PSEUX|nr:hypothetical protein [Pseudonocardia dioxanivorans]AEA28916.1 hypothetical protein Psed_6845 [Pseudonocardia dioxanivorans CB1190]